MDLAAWTHNTNISILGYEPMRLVTGKSVNIPGVSIGNEATECLFDSECVQKIMERHHEFMKKFREHEYSLKLRTAAQSRSSQMNNRFYQEGDEVFFQEKDKKAWLGPVKVFCQRGREVYLFSNGNIRKVSSCKVKPFRCDQDNDVETNKLELSQTGSKEVTFLEDDHEIGIVDPEKAVLDESFGSLNKINEEERDSIGTYWMLIEKTNATIKM